ncbi:MAG: hypothetical protein JO340_15495 [Acidobacteriaceae bacterium]|nr:hypothetical protein [Acidobacteriaceae bacterium]
MFPVLLALSAWFPLQGGAEENCLWMNAATAGGLLGGAASMSVVRVSPKSANIHAANAISGAGPTSADPDSIKYSGNGIDDSDCTFTRHSGSMTGELRIEVRTMNDPAREFSNFAARCDPHGTALNAIGNEASECAVDGKAGENTEQVVGRVRDRAFVIRLRVSGPSMPPELLREKVRKAAEIVSGNLF